VPDPETDTSQLVSLLDRSSDEAQGFVKCLRSNDEWRCRPLRVLLPGLPLLDSATFEDRLSSRAMGGLARADIRSWASLADLTPLDLFLISGIGRGSVDEILLAASEQWALAYLSAQRNAGESNAGERVQANGTAARLLGRAPDPKADVDLLRVLGDPSCAETRRLAERLLVDEDLRMLSLRELFPGVGVVESPVFSTRLSVRAVNCLVRANADTLRDLAEMRPAEIFALPNVGKKSSEEILAVVIAEWAAAYLSSVGDDAEPKQGASSNDEAPPLRPDSLAKAFTDVEGSGFEAFRRRRLEAGKRPSLGKLAMELGISAERVAQLERKVEAGLLKRMRDRSWPISIAVAEMQDRLGSAARRNVFEEFLVEVDPHRKVFSDRMLHRRALLLWLAHYCHSTEWITAQEIGGITRAILDALTEHGPAELDAVERHLKRIGVREDQQLPWIASQPGFRIFDGAVECVAGE
jgi:hypothetical protein